MENGLPSFLLEQPQEVVDRYYHETGGKKKYKEADDLGIGAEGIAEFNALLRGAEEDFKKMREVRRLAGNSTLAAHQSEQVRKEIFDNAESRRRRPVDKYHARDGRVAFVKDADARAARADQIQKRKTFRHTRARLVAEAEQREADRRFKEVEKSSEIEQSLAIEDIRKIKMMRDS